VESVVFPAIFEFLSDFVADLNLVLDRCLALTISNGKN
jgi:hypothetical protein